MKPFDLTVAAYVVVVVLLWGYGALLLVARWRQRARVVKGTQISE